MLAVFGSIFEYAADSVDKELCVVSMVRDYDSIELGIDGLELICSMIHLGQLAL